MAKRKVTIEIAVVKARNNQLENISKALKGILDIVRGIHRRDIAQELEKISNALTDDKNKLGDVAQKWKEIGDAFEVISDNANKVVKAVGAVEGTSGDEAHKPFGAGGEFGTFLSAVFKVNALTAVISGRLIPALAGAGVALKGTSFAVKSIASVILGATVIVKSFVVALQFTKIVTILTVKLLALAAAFSVVGFAIQIKKLAAFQEQLRKTSNLLIGTGQNLRTLGKEAAALTLLTRRNVGDVLEGQFQAVTTGARDAEIRIQALTEANKLLVTSGGTLATNVNLLTTVMEAYGLKAEEMADVSKILFGAVSVGNTNMQELSDKLGPLVQIAGAFGFAFDETVASVVQISKGSKDATIAITQMKNVLNSLIKIVTTDTVKARKFKTQLRALGVETRLAKIQQQGLIETLAQLSKAADRPGGGNVVAGAFGDIRALAGAASLLQDNAEGVSADLEEMTRVGDNLGKAYRDSAGDFNFLVDAIRGLLEMLLGMGGRPLAIVEEVLKAFEVLLVSIVKFTQTAEGKLGGFVNSVLGPFGEFFIGTFLDIAAIVDGSKSWGEIVAKSIEAMAVRAAPLLNIFKELFKNTFIDIGAFVAKSMPIFLEQGFHLMISFIKTIGKQLLLRGLVIISIELISFITEVMLDIWVIAIEQAVKLFTGMLDIIVRGLGTLFNIGRFKNFDTTQFINFDAIKPSELIRLDDLTDIIQKETGQSFSEGDAEARAQFEEEAGQILGATIEGLQPAVEALGSDLVDTTRQATANLEQIKKDVEEQDLPGKLEEAWAIVLEERAKIAEMMLKNSERLRGTTRGNRPIDGNQTGSKTVPPRRR